MANQAPQLLPVERAAISRLKGWTRQFVARIGDTFSRQASYFESYCHKTKWSYRRAVEDVEMRLEAVEKHSIKLERALDEARDEIDGLESRLNALEAESSKGAGQSPPKNTRRVHFA